MPSSFRRPVKDLRSAAPVSALPSWLERDWFFGLLLLLAVIVAYAPIWQAGFIWDDDGHITRPELRSWAGLERIWFELGVTQQYYPLLESVFWVEHRIWGDLPLGYHLVNVVLHAFSAFLLFKILQRLEVPGAALATAIFALHPVQVESVAWITELKNVLSGVFYFASALLYLKYDRSRKTTTYAPSLILFVLGLISKTVIATMPAALLVVFWWKRGKLSWKSDAVPLIPFFIVGLSSGLFTAWMERHLVGAEGADYNLTLIERVLLAGHDVWFYLSKLLWPGDLIFIYPRWQISQAIWWQYLFPIAAVLVALFLAWLSRKWRGPLAGYLFFCGTLFPALGFSNVYAFRYSYVADHWQYLACLGVIVPFAAGMARLADAFLPERPRLRITLGAGLLLVLGTLSWNRTLAYENQETLWNDTLAQNPGCWMAHNNLGFLLLHHGQVDEATAHFRKALELNPNYAEAHYSLGMALFQKGMGDENPNRPPASAEITEARTHYHRGLDLYAKRQEDKAITEFQEALKLNPNYAEAHFSLGLALSPKSEEDDDAKTQLPKNSDIQPNYAKIHYSLGLAFSRSGQMDEAIAEFEKALALDPQNVAAHNDLGIALFQTGRQDEALAQFQEAVKINPDDLQAHNNLGIAYAQLGQTDAAIREFQAVVRLNPGDETAQRSLAQLQQAPMQK